MITTPYMEELTTEQVRRALETGYSTAIVMLGAQEQHGPHLPLSTDALWGRAVGGRVADTLGDALVAPTLSVGVSSEHMSFAGSMTIRVATFTALISDYVASLAQNGFRWIVLLPSHGGNVEPLQQALPTLRQQTGNAQLLAYTDLYELIGVGSRVAGDVGVSVDAAGAHAGEWETSMVLALRPELVATDRMEPGYLGDLAPVFDQIMSKGMESVTPNGILGDPRSAAASHGQAYLNALTAFYVDWIRAQRRTE